MSDNSGASTSRATSGIGFCGLLTIAFIVLKLVGVIDWPWIWVLAPMWISVALFVLIIVVILLIVFFKG